VLFFFRQFTLFAQVLLNGEQRFRRRYPLVSLCNPFQRLNHMRFRTKSDLDFLFRFGKRFPTTTRLSFLGHDLKYISYFG
jgi:hypothetical protein